MFAMKCLPACLLLCLIAAPLAAQAPAVFENGVVNGATYIPFGQAGHAPAPGSIVVIFGTSFASGLSQSMTVPLSTSLGGVSVAFNNVTAPLFYVTAGQIAAQMPAGITGSSAMVTVRNSAGTSPARTVQTAPTSPGIFTLNQQGTGQGIVVFATEPRVFAAVPTIQIPACPPPSGVELCARPARAGDFLTIYANGLGAVQPAVADGSAAPPAEPLARTVVNPEITVGNVRATNVLFSGLVPGLVGLYQINFQIPAAVATGNAVPLRIAAGGVTSSSMVTIAIQQ